MCLSYAYFLDSKYVIAPERIDSRVTLDLNLVSQHSSDWVDVEKARIALATIMIRCI
jgi:hypothetical protein